MSKTIKELADELGVSKQTIQYHYQRLLAKDRQRDSRGFNVVNPRAEQEIRGKVAKSLPPKNRQITDKEVAKNRQRGSKEKTSENGYLIEQIEDLKRQRDQLFASKKKELASKDRQIEKLSQLVDQSQQLQLLAQKKNEQLEKNLELETTKKTFHKSDNQPLKWWPFNKKGKKND
jgi:predicted ArsR family transcriptional regulator